MRPFRHVFLTLLLALPWLAVYPQDAFQPAGPQALDVLRLQHRSAGEIIPLLEPLLADGGKVSGRGDTLVLRAAPGELPQLRALVKRLDTPPRRLLVSVRQVGQGAGRQQHGGLILEGDSQGAGGQVRGQILSTRQDREIVQQVQVMEGHEAYLAVETELPRGWGWGENHPGWRHSRRAAGFYVLPRLRGDRVTVDITPHLKERDATGRLRSQTLSTRVSGRLGQWLPVAMHRRDAGADGIRSTRALRGEGRQIWLKLEELP